MRASGALMRRSIGPGSAWAFAVAASSPMTVLAGGVMVTYASTGVVGVPLSFVLVAAALGLLTVGYVAMARHIPHAAPAYALLAHARGRSPGGVGPSLALAGAGVALLGYNAMQVGLYGLLGAQLSAAAGGPWWMWALIGWLIIALVGAARVHLSTAAVVIVLVLELAVITALIIGAFTDPAGGHIDLTPIKPNALAVTGVGGALTFAVAALIGYESGPAFSEEIRGTRTVTRATFGALIFLGLLYAASAWALAVAVGPSHVVDAARSDPELPFTLMTHLYGRTVSTVASALFVSSMLGAMVSFHSTVARHLFALGREQVAPAWMAGTTRAGAPLAGSLTQSVLALGAVVTAVALGVDPVGGLFTWSSTVGAVAILVLLVACSATALSYFRAGGGTNEALWTRKLAPAGGVIAGGGVIAIVIANLGSLLGPAAHLWYVVPSVIGAAALAGALYAARLHHHEPSVYANVGRGRLHPLDELDLRLASVDV